MKKKTFLFMLITAVMTILTACSQDNLEDYYNNWANSNGGANAGGGSGSATAGSGELLSFDFTLDKTTAEPTETAEAYYPDEEDILENNEFATEIAIDLSNPTAKTENGVEVTVNGGHITANHGGW